MDIVVEVRGLTTEQMANLDMAMDHHSIPRVPSYNSDGTVGVIVTGRRHCLALVSILTNEDSGADYLV